MPEISFLVCTYNRERFIDLSIEALCLQNISPKRFEIIVIDNNSTDNTSAKVEQLIERNNHVDIKKFSETKQGLSYARNKAIDKSKSKIVAFIDDDAIAKPDYAEKVLNFFNDHREVMAAGGKVVPQYESQEPSWMSRYLLPLFAVIDLGNQKKFPKSKYPAGANMIFRRIVFEKYGKFNTALGRKGSGLESGEEKDMFFRIYKAKESVYYLPQVEVAHIIPKERTTQDFIRKQAKGIGKSENLRINKYPDKKINKFYSELIKVGATLILSLYFILLGKKKKAKMLVLFRYWIIKSLIGKYK